MPCIMYISFYNRWWGPTTLVLLEKVLLESICFPMCLGKWNVLRPISLLDIKDVKPTPKRTWWKEEEKEEKSLLLPQKQTPALVLLLAYGRSKPKWNDRKEQESREPSTRKTHTSLMTVSSALLSLSKISEMVDWWQNWERIESCSMSVGSKL